MRVPEDFGTPQTEHDVPPFWIGASPNGGVPIDQRVLEVAAEAWPWCYRHVQRCLHDGASAAEILESTAVKVSDRLREDSGVGRNLKAYLATAFLRSVQARARRDSRIRPEGLSRDLEAALRPTAEDWLKQVEASLLIDAITSHMDSDGQRIMNFRMLGYSWKLVAEHVGVTDRQARTRFYYCLRKAVATLFGPGGSHDIPWR